MDSRDIMRVVCFILVWVAGILLGYLIARDEQRAMAVKRGVGRYVADPKTGCVDFRYEIVDPIEKV